ncbi:MAG: hypothetical protein U9N52_04880 [Campylobacterota bacterium]|nr:hypothetical protein [Campylobacterota bacterium]
MYYESGYIDDYYYDGDVTSPAELINKVVSISKSFVLNGVDITSNINNFEIIKEDGTLSHTLSLNLSNYQINNSYILNKDIFLVVSIGADTYNFIILDAETDYKNNSLLICKTDGCTLDYPFSETTKSSTKINSNDVLNEFIGDIDHFINLGNFEFKNGNFFSDGSTKTAIQKILDVTDGTSYIRNNKILLTNKLKVGTNSSDLDISNSFIFDKKITKISKDSRNINTIKINSSSTNLYSDPSITMVYDNENLKDVPKFLFNPTPRSESEIESNLGDIVLTKNIELYKTYIDGNSINTSSGILKIFYILVDKVKIDSSLYQFEYGYDLIYFDGSIRGEIEVIYETIVLNSYSSFGSTVSDLTNFKVKYRGQILDESIKRNLSSRVAVPAFYTESKKLIKNYDFTFHTVRGSTSKVSLHTKNKDASKVEENEWLDNYGVVNTDFLNALTKTNDVISRTFSVKMINVSLNVPTYNESSLYGFIIFKQNNTIKKFFIGNKEVEFNKHEEDSYTVFYTKDLNFSDNIIVNVLSTYLSDRFFIKRPYSFVDTETEHGEGYIRVWDYGVKLESIGIKTADGVFMSFDYGDKISPSRSGGSNGGFRPVVIDEFSSKQIDPLKDESLSDEITDEEKNSKILWEEDGEKGESEDEFDKDKIDESNITGDTIPMIKKIDIASLLKVDAIEAAGKVINYNGKAHIINSAGFIEIFIETREKIYIDTGSILQESKIIIDSSSMCIPATGA